MLSNLCRALAHKTGPKISTLPSGTDRTQKLAKGFKGFLKNQKTEKHSVQTEQLSTDPNRYGVIQNLDGNVLRTVNGKPEWHNPNGDN